MSSLNAYLVMPPLPIYLAVQLLWIPHPTVPLHIYAHKCSSSQSQISTHQTTEYIQIIFSSANPPTRQRRHKMTKEQWVSKFTNRPQYEHCDLLGYCTASSWPLKMGPIVFRNDGKQLTPLAALQPTRRVQFSSTLQWKPEIMQTKIRSWAPQMSF